MDPTIETTAPGAASTAIYGTGKKDETAKQVFDRLMPECLTLAKTSAESILKLAIRLREASKKLPKESTGEYNFNNFCKKLGYEDGDDAQVKRLITLGKSAPKLLAYADHMPANYTTILAIGKLKDGAREKLVKNNKFTPAMTAATMREIVTGKKNTKSTVASAPTTPVDAIATVAPSEQPSLAGNNDMTRIARE